MVELIKTLKEKALEGKAPLKEADALLSRKEELKEEILEEASALNKELFGKAIDLYGVSYIADLCVNSCTYCGHSALLATPRNMLSAEEMGLDFSEVLKHGAGDLCILAGEHPLVTPDYLALAGNIALEQDGLGALERVTFNVAPMDIGGFSRLRDEIGFPLQFRLFQESYVPEVYTKHHPRGLKKDMGPRLGAQQRALDAGFDEVGLGVLMGLNPSDNDAEIMGLLKHAYSLSKMPYSVSLPRLMKAEGSSFEIPAPVDDDTYLLYHAILKLALPYTRTIITRRETPEMLDRIRPHINIEDLATRPGVGGNFRKESRFQNELGDTRETPEILQDLRVKGYKPIVTTK